MTTALLGNRLVIGNDVAELRRMSQWLRDSAAGSATRRPCPCSEWAA